MQSIERYREVRSELRIIHIDLDKNYDGVPKQERIVKEICEALTKVRCSEGNTKGFPVRVGLHQRLALSPNLFKL
ncbi:hypothetical protein J437_LFUL013948, partial [Ladona fulva]